ncbi:MAG: DJ-1 family glyoxalase III [Planctomycetota bacterium]|jgi:4-methyl-5(b-hydroxyethyl)-thiazole monophosphate biosynthesis
MSKKVLVPVADGTEELEAVTIIDCLRRAGADVTVASVDKSQITAGRGVRLVADTLISNCTKEIYDLIALPGGMPGAEHLRDSGELAELLKAQAKSGRFYAAICASPAVVLRHHGLLNGKRATCYPSLFSELDDSDDAKVVVDGNCITSQGPATALPFALKLIEILFDKEKADEVANSMLAKQP